MNSYYNFRLRIFSGILLVSILFAGTGYSQTKTNLEVLYSLNDSLVSMVCDDYPGVDSAIIRLNLGERYSLFSNHINNRFVNCGIEPVSSPAAELIFPGINIVLAKAGVEYGEIERDGWFGDYLTERTIFIDGNYNKALSGKYIQEFHIAVSDTVRVDDIHSLENPSFQFTKGKIPPEPFLSSLIEPVIAIGVAAVSIILFFSVRSK